MKMTTKDFEDGIDRLDFDSDRCSWQKGWAQVDTGQDAPYFGIWAHPVQLKVMQYIEGDVIETVCDTVEEFVSEIQDIKTFNNENGWGFKGIDPMGVPAIAEAFREMGLGDLLH